MLKKDRIAKLKNEMQKRLEEKVRCKKMQPRDNYTPPRYDEVYYEGVKWLDEYG